MNFKIKTKSKLIDLVFDLILKNISVLNLFSSNKRIFGICNNRNCISA